jgi:hypothetical protein
MAKYMKYNRILKEIIILLIIVILFFSSSAITIMVEDHSKQVTQNFCKYNIQCYLPFDATIISEGFEEGIMPPEDWVHDQFNTLETWHIGEDAPYSGTYCARCYYDANYTDEQDEWIISPVLDFSGYVKIYLSFWWFMSYYWGVDPFDNYDLNIWISLDHGENWELLWNEDNIGEFDDYVYYNSNFGEHIDLSIYSGETDVLIGFQYYGYDGAQMNIDDILIYGIGAEVECDGHLSWFDVKPSETVYGEFQISNQGEDGSYLNWEIINFATWGDWNIEPDNGEYLAAGDSVTINVAVTAPSEENEDFNGLLRVKNTDDSNDFCDIDLYLLTFKNKPSHICFNLLGWLWERYPNAFPFLRSLFLL